MIDNLENHRSLSYSAVRSSLTYTYHFMRSRHLGFTELTLLTLLADDSISHTLTSLSSTLHCTPGCLSPILHRLETCSLICSFPSHHDKRKTYYTLTPSDGTSLINSFLNPRASGALASKS